MLYEWVYRNYIKFAGVKVYGKIFQLLHTKLLYVKDPIIEYEIRGEKCRMPFSHAAPYNMKLYAKYDIPLKKICEYIRGKMGHTINIIDVGANIGDSVLNINIRDARYLLVEGTKKYAELIKSNLQAKYDYILESVFLSDEAESRERGGYGIEVSAGTASICKDNKNVNGNIVFMTLDDVVSKYKFEPHIIKIDTDGFDFKVLRGSKQTLKKYAPVIFLNGT